MPSAPEALCVHCRRASAAARWRPFCSERCKLLDLSRWVDGGYRIAGEPLADQDSGGDEPSPLESR